LADPFPEKNDGSFPNDVTKLQGYLEIVARKLLINFPNIKIAYYSSRTHAYTSDPTTLNPEPFAYESGFAVQGMIQDQINGLNNLNYDPSKGTVVAPLILWGPYLWATSSPRSDGFTWLTTELSGDLTHPSVSGVQKVGEELLAFFKTDPTATPWFLKPTPTGQGPVVTVSADVVNGSAPLTVQFTASATDANATITQYAWTYDDGDFSFDQNPTKIFDVPGTYNVHLTVSDSLGNTAEKVITITVGGTSSGGGSGGGGNGGGGPVNADNQFLILLFEDLLGRQPSQMEISSYSSQLDSGSLTRNQLTSQLINTQEYRTDVVNTDYATILQRPVDTVGLSTWVSFLAGGGTELQLQAQLLGSGEFFAHQGGSTNNGFLNALYQNALSRAIDAAGLQTWTQALVNGMSRTAVATAVLSSPESDADQVQALYQRFLSRAADPAGLNTFVNALEQGASIDQVIATIVASSEFAPYQSQLYVAQLYKDLLRRTADAAGLATFTAALENGTATRQQVVQAILSSSEYQSDVVQNWYNLLLHRPADPAGLNGFSTFLEQGGTDQQLAALLAGSGEYFTVRGGGTNDGFLTALYQDTLGRAVDAAGRAAWDQALATGTTRQQVAAAIFASGEYDTNLVQNYYQTYLGRAADTAGLNSFVGSLESGATDESVILAIATSNEYFARA
jgi:PKD repeat protein